MADYEIKKENIITTGNMTLFFCNFCNECYTQARSFKLHYRAHKSFTCNDCEKVFYLKRQFLAHLRSHDTTIKEYTCEKCYKVFHQEKKLEMHKCISDTKKSHICDVCEVIFSSRKLLKEHLLTHSTDESYKCEICEESFPDETSLQAHNFTHVAQKNCTYSKITDTKQDEVAKDAELKHHKSIPKVKTLHKCDECQKIFTNKILLEKHFRIHKKQKLQGKNVTKRTFSELPRSNNRTIEKPYVCNLCLISFSRKSSLNSHDCTKKEED